jgi:hypothetical protein
MFSQTAKFSFFLQILSKANLEIRPRGTSMSFDFPRGSTPGRRPWYLAVLGNTSSGVAKFVLKGLSREMDLALMTCMVSFWPGTL